MQSAAHQGYIPAYRRLGDIFLHRKGMPLLAKDYYTIAADAGDPMAIKSLADLYFQENNLPKALEYYEKLAPKYPSIWQKISDIHLQMGDQKKAAEAYTKFQEVHEYYHWHR